MTQARLAAAVRTLRGALAERDAAGQGDAELLHAFAARRDPAAFAELVRRHGPMVLGVCRRQLGNEHDAEDAFQATFLVLARKAGSVRRAGALGCWLHGVSYRIAMRAKREAARRRARETTKVRPVPPADPAQDLAWREVKAALDEEVQALPPIYRAAFVLCCLDGVPNAEAARRLGLKEGTVCSRLAKARTLLRAALGRRGVSLSAALAALAVSGGASVAVPRALADAAARAAVQYAAGATAGLSAKVLFLAEGALRTVFTAKMKIATALLVAVGVFGAGAGFLSQPGAAAGEPPPSAKAPEPAAETPDPGRRPDGEEKPGAVTVRGRVLDPDGKPVRGAKVYVSTYTYKDRTDPDVRATTDADGRFRFTAKKAEVDRNEAVAAAAEGYGPDWVELGKIDLGQELTLKLVKDVPITGRVLDLEGRPVAGATVHFLSVWKMPGEDLTPLVKDLRGAADRSAVGDVWIAHQQKISIVFGVRGAPKQATTDRDGRFRLGGYGGERVVAVRIEGPGIASARLDVLTRPGLTGLPPGTHASAFEHVAGPDKPVRGVVRDRRTGKPVAGVTVLAQPALEGGPGGAASAETDAAGRFEIAGLPKAKSYHLSAGKVPYISGYKELADTPGLEPITADFELERALKLRLRVFDKRTGRPVRAYVQYAIRTDNPHLKDYPSYPRNVVSWDGTERDGRFEQTALPGPALIAVQAIEGEFTRARLGDEQSDSRLIGGLVPVPLALDNFHAVVPVSPDANDPKSLTVEIALDPGRSVGGEVVDPDGKPLGGVTVAGLTAVKKTSDRATDTLAGPEFTAVGLEPEHPRTLVFLREEKRLAKAVTLRGDEKGPLTVRLEPLGALTGRLADREGRPVAGVQVRLSPARSLEPTLPGELVIGGIGTLRGAVKIAPVKTDEQGRFRFGGLIPGMKYELQAAGRELKGTRLADLLTDRGRPGVVNLLGRELTATPGKEVDLGDVPPKPSGE